VPEATQLGLGLHAACPGQTQGEEQQGGDLGGVRLGRRHADLEPARVKKTKSASRVAWLPMMLVRASTGEPAARARRIAASVSAVSPDCVMPITRVSGSKTGSRYRNSLATSICTGTRASCSITYDTTRPA